MTLNEFFDSSRQLTDEALKKLLPPVSDDRSQLRAAMRYSALVGGKRLRPTLVRATAHTFGGSDDQILAPALAVELIHAYSLVHDDLPAMDDDELRRGQPTCHIAFDEATAILAGDALQTLAFDVLAGAETLSPTQRLGMLRRLSQAAGAEGMVGGQALDLAASSEDLDAAHLERIHRLKTGALINAAIELGAISAGIDDDATLNALRAYGNALGLAFQVRDDILDVEGCTRTLGKPQGSDRAQDKLTYPALLGLDGARHRLAELHAQARDALSTLQSDPQLLLEIADFVVERQY